jgi:hypothetical protein
MGFWKEVAAGFLGNVAAGFLLVLCFLQVTDITIGYGWKWDGPPDDARNVRPAVDIRNLSRSRTYKLSNVAYLKDGRPVASVAAGSLARLGFASVQPGMECRCKFAPLRSSPQETSDQPGSLPPSARPRQTRAPT